MKILYYTVLTLAFFSNVWSGSKDLLAQESPIYIVEDSTQYILGVSSRYRTVNVYIANPNERLNIELEDISLGVRVRYKWVNLAVLTSIGEINRDDKLVPSLFNVDLKLYPKKLFLKVNLQYYSLFSNTLNLIPKPLSSIPDDSKIVAATLYTAYLFKGDQLSLSSVYSFVDRQKTSSGSWMVSIFSDYQRLNFKESDIPKIEQFQQEDFIDIEKWRLGIGGGYTYSWVIGNFTLNGLASGGFESSYLHSNISQSMLREADYLINPKVRFMGSAVYHYKNYYIAVLGEFQPNLKTQTDIEFNRQFYWTKLSMGKKF